jgi:hypothetical protein
MAEQEDFKTIRMDFRSGYTSAGGYPPDETSPLLAILAVFFFLPPDIRRWAD